MSSPSPQLDLFAPRPRPRRSLPHRGGVTQIAAAEKIEPHAAKMRAAVFDYIAQCGAAGATRKEIQLALDMKIQTVCPRVDELIHRDRTVVSTTIRRGGGLVLVAKAEAKGE